MSLKPPHHAPLTRWALILSALALLAATIVVAAPARAADTTFENCLTAKHNAARAAAGLSGLQTRSDMVSYARSHTDKMIAEGGIFHSKEDLLRQATSGWSKLGENVGRGGTCDSLHNEFMSSESHRKNVLNPAYTSIGVGGDSSEGVLYVTVIFAQHGEPEPSPTTTTTAPTTMTTPTTTTTAPPATTTTTAAPRTTTTEAPAAETSPEAQASQQEAGVTAGVAPAGSALRADTARHLLEVLGHVVRAGLVSSEDVQQLMVRLLPAGQPYPF